MKCRTNQLLPAAVATLVLVAGQSIGFAQQQDPAAPAQPQQTQPDPQTPPSEPDAPAPQDQQPQPEQAQQPQDNPEAQAEAKRILQRVRDYYANLQGVTVEIDMATTVDMEGEEIKQEQPALKVAAQRPNRAALRVDENGEQYALVSDGDTLWHYMGDVLNAYTQEDAPESFGGLIDAAAFGQTQDASSLIMMPHVIVLALLDGDRFDEMIDAASAVRFLGQEEIDGRTVDHVRIEMDTIDADMWVRSGEEAWVERISPDMGKMFEGMEGAENFTPPKFEVTFADWTQKEQFDDAAFAFTPPEEAKKVASLMEAMQEQMGGDMAMGQEAESDLLGKPAPELGLELLGGGKVDLATHKKNKEIVVLDFWATWCPPCVRGLPLVAGVADEFKDKGVVFYAVNQREEPEVIRAFLEKKDLDIKVPLDKEGKVGDAYGVTGIPQTVIIGKDGTVQAVHVGFMPGMEDQLREELQSLIDGKDLAAAAAAGEVQQAAEDAMEVETAWSRQGRFGGVAANPATGETFAVTSAGGFIRLNRAGEEIAAGRLEKRGDGGTLRLANLVGDEAPELLTFGAWGPAVRAFDAEGKLLWEREGGEGIDDVWAADLDGPDGDGFEEVIVGYNGGTGLHVFNADGEPRWQYTNIGNVWHVTAANSGPAGEPEVITTSAAGQVHVFNADGTPDGTLSAGGYANLVRPAGAALDGEAAFICSIGNGQGLSAITRSGTLLWKAPVKGESHITSGIASPDRPWFAVAVAQGRVLVYDVHTGERLATLKTGMQPAVSWIPAGDDGSPLLVIASGSDLKAVTLRPKVEEAVAEPRRGATPRQSELAR